MTIGPVPVGKW